MTLGVVALLDGLKSHAQALGMFERVIGHEPHNAPGSGLSCAIWAGPVDPVGSSLVSTTTRVEFTARMYVPGTSPDDSTETTILALVDGMCGSLTGDFTVGGLARQVDCLGEAGAPLAAKLGWVVMEGQQYRIADVTIPLIVNDLWTQGA